MAININNLHLTKMYDGQKEMNNAVYYFINSLNDPHIFPPFPPIMYKTVDISITNEKDINALSMHKQLVKLLNIEFHKGCNKLFNLIIYHNWNYFIRHSFHILSKDIHSYIFKFIS